MADRRRIAHLLCGQIYVRDCPGVDEAIAALATRQHGVVARRQLRAIGISGRAIEHRLAVGRLRPLFRGVYACGHEALAFSGRCVAAVLASRGSPVAGVAASHGTAAAIWELIDPPAGWIHVTADHFRATRPGIVAHRATMPDADVTHSRGIPLTTPARTLLDLAGDVRSATLRRLVKKAEFEGLVGRSALVEVLERHPKRPGRRKLAAMVADGVLDTGRSRSELEDRFLEFCRTRGLPLPRTNQRVEAGGRSFEVDCVWPAERVIAELDGFAAHGGRMAFEDDRARDRVLASAGWLVLRVTWAQLHTDARSLASELRAILNSRQPT